MRPAPSGRLRRGDGLRRRPGAGGARIRGRGRASGSTSSTSTPRAPASGANLGVIEAICASVSCKVQTGGGVRSVEAAGARAPRRASSASSSAPRPWNGPSWCPSCASSTRAMSRWGSTAAVERSPREVGSRGPASTSSISSGGSTTRRSAALIVTSIGHDGTFKGPDLEQLGSVLEATSVPVIASGGVGTLDDLRELAALRACGQALCRRDRRQGDLRTPLHRRRGGVGRGG